MEEQQRVSHVASSSNSSKKYDVFLSFHGKDTRKNFTSVLYAALTEAKIVTFIDDQLEKGDKIAPALIEAIEDSHISVVIFSENYATSKWCLNELIEIMKLNKENKQIVIPVFYNIDPTHVRKQTGSYQKAFVKHEGELMCNEWKAALREAANLSGWHSSQDRYDSELLKDIVRVVTKNLPRTCPNNLKFVGIEDSLKEIESLLKIGSNENEVITLGIWGMGGIGKTTLARALYDKLSHQFEGCCFLADVRENSLNLQLQTLCDKLFFECFKNKNLDRRRLPRKKLLIVLDDVSTPEQIEKLIEEYYVMGNGSLVIITTRDKQILSTTTEIYPLKVLNRDHSLQLFCLYAFQEKQPKQPYEYLSRRVISYCKGVPLALKVLGACLKGKSEEAWESELIKLQMIPKKTIYDVLKISYDSLEDPQNDIFLDIACFFKGENRDRVTEILEGFDFFPESASGIEVLLDKALITISNDNQIQMHDLIQEMGREVVHKKSGKNLGKRSRLWKHEEVLHVLKYNKGTEDVEGIILDLFKLKEDLYMRSDFLAKMPNVRFLKIHEGCQHSNKFNVYIRGVLQSLSDKLRYLYWDRCCLESLPSKFCAEQLVELCMRKSSLEKLWDEVQNLVNLKTIDLSFSGNLMKIPDLSKAKNLEKADLHGCRSLRQLHPSMSSLPKLTYLYLRNCQKIESLKISVHATSLDVLEVRGCSLLKEFLVTSEKIKILDLAYTALEELVLCGTIVESLSANIINLSKLTRLQLKGCKECESLPKLPPSLTELCLNDCWKLESLPELPETLLKLHLKDCQKLVSLSKLPPSVKMVSAFNCNSLNTHMTEELMLEHILQSGIPYLDYFIFPGNQITNESWIRTTESSLTIPDLPKFDLLGFICCIIFSYEQDLCDSHSGSNVSIEIYQDAKKIINYPNMKIQCPVKLISDHMFFSYVEISQFDKINEVSDHEINNITFEFKCLFLDKKIKGCGVFPVYATTPGLKLVNRSTKVGHDQENMVNSSQDDESQARATGNNENEDDCEQLLPRSKRQRSS